MKSMVHGWIRDVTQYQNVFADHQIIHFYRSVIRQKKILIVILYILIVNCVYEKRTSVLIKLGLNLNSYSKYKNW